MDKVGKNFTNTNDTYQTEVEVIDKNLIKGSNSGQDKLLEKLQELPAVQKAAELLRMGEVVAFPTETVYGLGADATNEEAVKKIFRAKGRPQDNPLIVHIASRKQLNQVVKEINKTALSLIQKFWPGPLTIIAEKNPSIPHQTTAGLESVAIRMPSHPVARAIIKKANLPIAAPSANLSGTPSPTTAKHVLDDLQGRIPLIVDGGSSWIGIESTVVDTRGQQPVILRPGGITREEIERVLGYNLKNSFKLDRGERPVSPGMKYRHYSPDTPLLLVYSIQELQEKVRKFRGCKVGLVITTETERKIAKLPDGVEVVSMGSAHEPERIASRIFSILRYLDILGLDYIIIEAIPEKGLGLAVMNRLSKASLNE